MESARSRLVLVVIAGPQASGKSALAAALTARLREHGELVALTELDQVAAMALPTLPSWDAAHHIFETITGMWARTELTCVVAEGSGHAEEVSRVLSQAPSDAATVVVAITAPLEVAFSRAQADPTRGVSKERTFLTKVYEQWPRELDRMNADVVIDSGALSIDEGTELVREAIRRARVA